MDLFNGNNRAPILVQGQRLITSHGWEGADKIAFPIDCEAAIFDEDDDYCFIKKTDTNGNATLRMFRLEEVEIPRFDPKKYVTVDDFNSFKEDILNGFNSLQQTIQNGNSRNTQQRDNRGNSKQNNGINEPQS